MFWTAFVWGLGGSLGASIGLMSLVVMWHFFDRVANSKRLKSVDESLQALLDRNEISDKMLVQMTMIADVMKKWGGS